MQGRDLFCQDGGGPLCPADTVGAPEEGHLSASEPAGGGEQKQSSQSPTGSKYLTLNCSLFGFEVLLDFRLIVLFCLFTEICANQKSNSLIQAEPPELHFSGFELQKEYTQTLVRRPTFLFLQATNGLLKQIKYTWFVLVLSLFFHFYNMAAMQSLFNWTEKNEYEGYSYKDNFLIT